MLPLPQNNKTLRILVIILYSIAGLALAVLFFLYLFKYFIPFLLAWVIAVLIEPVVSFLTRRLRFPRGIASFVTVILSIFLIGLVIYFIVSQLFSEILSLRNFNIDIQQVVDRITSYLESFDNFFHNMPGGMNKVIDIDKIYSSISDAVGGFVANITQKLPNALMDTLGRLASVVPAFLINTLIMIIAAVYISADLHTINAFVSLQLPEKFRERISRSAAHLVRSVSLILRSYLILMCITFGELLIGFTIIGVNYAVTIALFTAIIDIFPVLGTGTVLVPWGVISILTGNIGDGIAILVLYAIVTIVRQTLEPRIVGQQLGIYPLVTLMCMFIGLQTLGIGGMFGFPLLFIFLKYFHDSGVIRLWKPLPAEAYGPPKKHASFVENIVSVPYRARRRWERIRIYDYRSVGERIAAFFRRLYERVAKFFGGRGRR